MVDIKELGVEAYEKIWLQMKHYTQQRDANSPDELWLLEHPPVYTQGQAGKAEHILNPGTIPIIQSDRGGQVTYHGPGQLIGYVLMDIKRRNLGIRTLVGHLENTLMNTLKHFDISAQSQCGAPGVYVSNKKIASIGLRVKNGCTYHGIALNIDMDLLPFKRINPCGFAQLEMTQIKEYVSDVTFLDVKERFKQCFIAQFAN